jgi:hypothetical protein
MVCQILTAGRWTKMNGRRLRAGRLRRDVATSAWEASVASIAAGQCGLL